MVADQDGVVHIHGRETAGRIIGLDGRPIDGPDKEQVTVAITPKGLVVGMLVEMGSPPDAAAWFWQQLLLLAAKFAPGTPQDGPGAIVFTSDGGHFVRATAVPRQVAQEQPEEGDAV